MRALLSALALWLAGGASLAHAEEASTFNPHALPVPAALSVHQPAAALAEGVSDLKFGEVFKRPVGPKGLEPSARLRALDGQRVRMAGFMVARASATPGQFILSPVPVLLGDEDESFSDDLPPSAVFVHLHASAKDVIVANLHGLLQIVGTLRVGAQEEADGRVSAVRIELDAATSRLMPLVPQLNAGR